MKALFLCAALLAGATGAGCGTVAPAAPDAGPDGGPPAAATLVEGHLVTGTVDDGFEHTAWACAGDVCVQGSIKP